MGADSEEDTEDRESWFDDSRKNEVLYPERALKVSWTRRSALCDTGWLKDSGIMCAPKCPPRTIPSFLCPGSGGPKACSFAQ